MLAESPSTAAAELPNVCLSPGKLEACSTGGAKVGKEIKALSMVAILAEV